MRRRELFVKRPQRQKPPLPLDEVEIPRYPNEPSKPQQMSKLLVFAPSLGMIMMAIGLIFVYKNYTYSIIIVAVGLTYAAVNLFRQREQEKRYQKECERVQSAYVNHIQEVEVELKKYQEQQASYLRTVYPRVDEIVIWAWEDSLRIWERSSKDEDFLDLRLGTGDVSSSYSIKLPKVDIPELAPPQLLEAREMALGYQTLEELPITFPFLKGHTLAILGPPALREGMARSLLAQIAGLHAPKEVEVFAIFPSNKISTWEWLKWLPHCQTLQYGSAIPHIAYESETIRKVYSGLLDILDERELKEQDRARDDPALVLLVTDPDLILGETAVRRILDRGQVLNAKMILLAPNSQEVPEGFIARMSLINDQMATLQLDPDSRIRKLIPELTELGLVERLARGLAPLQLADEHSPVGLPGEIRLLELVGSPELEHLDLGSRWMEALSHPPDLHVPLGMRHGQRPLIVDLKQSGVGPHGLIAGTTGSGKSELLLTLLTSLALNHHPHQVNFMLIDYKGGTAMNVLKDLPHTVGVVTDLDGKQTRRALVALGSEMERREAILTRYQVADIDKYHQLGLAEPFPYLFIVIDEFAELRDRFREDLGEILREFVSVAQKGRALGVHLILAMQKPEGVVNDSIRANMKFRISLRVERAEDSRNVLGRPDAYLLPHQPPGRAYFQVGRDEQFDLFQVARVAGYHRPRDVTEERKAPILIQEVGPDGQRIPIYEIAPSSGDEERSLGLRRTEAQLIVEKAMIAAEQLKIQKLPSPWPPPLPERVHLQDLFQQLQVPVWDGENWSKRQDWDGVPVALLDEPIQQQQRPLLLNPLEDGNILIVGAPGSGRTNFLLTFASSLVLSMSPDWVHLHMIDFGGHQLRAACSSFPHMAGVYEGSEVERIRRLLSTLNVELEERRKTFSEVGAVSLRGYRRANPDAPPLPLILTMINNFSGFYDEFRDEMIAWNRQLREGGSYGLYFVLASDRVPTGRTVDLLQTRIALRVADRTWYSLILGSRPDLTTHDPHPGRGFISTKPPTELQIAVPMEGTPEEQIAGLQDLGENMSRSWVGGRPELVRILAEQVALAEVLPEDVFDRWPIREDLKTWIGLDHNDLLPVLLDLEDVGSSMLITGPPESGKTTALATIALSFAATHHPDRMKMGFVSLGRSVSSPFKDLEKLPHSLGLTNTLRRLDELLADVEVEVETRVSQESDIVQDRPHLAIFIDDYHLIATRADKSLIGRLENLIQRGQEAGVTLFVVVPNLGLSGAGDSIIRRLKSGRTGLWLKSTDFMEARSVGLSIQPHMRGQQWPPGRGYLYDPGGQLLLQLASWEIESPEASYREEFRMISEYVKEIMKCIEEGGG
jgi:S-DNA-T family DNA segregation ATPase FtsK/SpoIIIE